MQVNNNGSVYWLGFVCLFLFLLVYCEEYKIIENGVGV